MFWEYTMLRYFNCKQQKHKSWLENLARKFTGLRN